ncbi:MAG TPA: BatD family protein [Candidatus Binatia bacterium]|nr:BatD family protein [Candidatus Binatia bacterium]
MRRIPSASLNWFAICVACVLCVHGASAATLTATLDRNVVPVGETVTLSLTFEGVQPQGTPQLPSIPNLAPQGVQSSTSVQIINGQMSQRISYNYTLAATQPGDVVIPAMQVQLAGQALSTQPLGVRITPASSPANVITNLAFVRLIVPKTEIYVGEAIPVEIQLYYRSVEGVQMPQVKAEGFSVSPLVEPTQTQTQVGNVIYSLLVFKSSATPARAGNLKLGPAECSLTILIPTQRRDPFDPFGFFGPTHQRKPTTLASDPVEMRVLPLPTENVPSGFNGAVGSYAMNVTASPTNVAVGDPITVKINITGSGRLDAITLPEQSQWRDFNTYPPEKKVQPGDPRGLSGSVLFDCVLTPQNHEIRTLPPVEFSFFDPAQRQYRTLRGPAFPLSVRSATVANAPPPMATNANASAEAPPADDILHIRPQFAESASGALLIRQPWFLGLQAVPVLTWLALLVARKRRENLANNPRLRRQREVVRRVREGLRELHLLATTQNSDAFFATLFRLLQEQIGERLDMPASAITEAIIEERLRQSNMPTATVAELHDLFQMCNQARFAPQKTSQELSALIPRVEAVLRDLQKLNA